MKLKLFQIDAFTDRLFAGNPAAVCPLSTWLPDEQLLQIASENNLSETAFYVAEREGFRLRWFTPMSEMNLCGHATLATAYALFNVIGINKSTIRFYTRSGDLVVEKVGNNIVMNFPALTWQECDAPSMLNDALGINLKKVLKGDFYVAILDGKDQVRSVKPNYEKLKGLDKHAVAVTAAGTDCDFVSRFFAPKVGVNEDPVTGSLHCMLTPYWSKQLNKTRLIAKQLSARGGELTCELVNDRVMLIGRAALYLEGEINIG
jgi:PhzF family phenazine biosynthesis protein